MGHGDKTISQRSLRSANSEYLDNHSGRHLSNILNVAIVNKPLNMEIDKKFKTIAWAPTIMMAHP